MGIVIGVLEFTVTFTDMFSLTRVRDTLMRVYILRFPFWSDTHPTRTILTEIPTMTKLHRARASCNKACASDESNLWTECLAYPAKHLKVCECLGGGYLCPFCLRQLRGKQGIRNISSRTKDRFTMVTKCGIEPNKNYCNRERRKLKHERNSWSI